MLTTYGRVFGGPPLRKRRSGTAENKRKCIKLDLNSKLEINLTYMVSRQNRGIPPNLGRRRGPPGSASALRPLE